MMRYKDPENYLTSIFQANWDAYKNSVRNIKSRQGSIYLDRTL